MAESFQSADHLPKRRGPKGPVDPEGLPRQRRGTTPQMHGRYPDFDVLAEADHWDETTRRVVFDRVDHPPEIRFFSSDEARTLSAFCDTVTAQNREPKIPVLRYIDGDLHEGKLDGHQHVDMPPDGEVFRIASTALDAEARRRGTASFADAEDHVRQDICASLSRGELLTEDWRGTDQRKAWQVLLHWTLKYFYSHPWAWNEIGFGGPAYPRGFVRLGAGQKEHWEGAEALDVDPVVDLKLRRVE